MNEVKSSVPRRPPLAQRRRARRLLVQALYQWQLSSAELHDIEAQFRADTQGHVDWNYFHELLGAIPRQVERLDALLTPHLDRAVTALDPVERALLRMASFELTDRVDVPYRVVINEAVELAKVFGATDSHKYVNGVLDTLARQVRGAEVASVKR